MSRSGGGGVGVGGGSAEYGGVEGWIGSCGVGGREEPWLVGVRIVVVVMMVVVVVIGLASGGGGVGCG